jgi:phosphohistidine phosphatase
MTDDRRTLVLLRHAKSAYPDGVADQDRPLAPRGEREAGLAGDWLRGGGSVTPPVQAVLCSTATRTRQTLAYTGIDAPVQFVERLYGAMPGGVISEINSVAGVFDFDVRTLLVIGHEPAMSAVALALAGAAGTNETAAGRISTKYPTSALAVLKVDGLWQDLEVGGAALETFYVPR